MERTEQIKTTNPITRIMNIIEEYHCCPDEISLFKTACEVYEISQEDARIADNVKDYWKCQNSYGSQP